MKLEKVEFGGVKGRILSQLVLNIFNEFQEIYKVFGERSYNPLDPTDNVIFFNLCIVDPRYYFFKLYTLFVSKLTETVYSPVLGGRFFNRSYS